MKIQFVGSERGAFFYDDIKKAIATLPDKGGMWEIESPKKLLLVWNRF